MNNLKYLPYDFSFDEKKLAYELIILKNEKVRSIINYNIRNKSTNTILSKVTKYLLHVEKIKPTEARVMLRKYAVTIAYMYLSSVTGINIKEFGSIKLNDILNNMSVDKLREDIKLSGIFGDLYNDNDYNDALKKLEKKLNKDKSTVYNNIYKLLRGEFNYFSKNTNILIFEKYLDMKRFDLIVSTELLDNTFVKFDIEFDDDFILNIKSDKLTSAQIRMAKVYMGHLIYQAFNNSNYDLQGEINPLNNSMFVLYTLDKDSSLAHTGLSFLMDGINLEEVEYFTFKYNGIQGEFTKSGIKYHMFN